MAKERKGIFNGNTPQIAMFLRLGTILVLIVLGWADTKNAIKQNSRDFETYREQAIKDGERLGMEGCVPARSVVTAVAVMTEQVTTMQKDIDALGGSEQRILAEIRALKNEP